MHNCIKNNFLFSKYNKKYEQARIIKPDFTHFKILDKKMS